MAASNPAQRHQPRFWPRRQLVMDESLPFLSQSASLLAILFAG
jgi:hypothetical protein